ncbi:MAG: hypothetical protein U9Q16_00460 [Patescibacteria group bacterium]|nr:hypothetical protein [Patescibacteria group bacterium]
MKLSKIKNFIEQFLLIVAKNIFSCCLFFLLLSVLLSGLIFYKYVINPQKISLDATEDPFLIEEEMYQNILEKWQIKEKKFIEAGLKEYSDPFEKPILVPNEELTE